MIPRLLDSPPVIRRLHRVPRNPGRERYGPNLPAALVLVETPFALTVGTAPPREIPRRTVALLPPGQLREFTFHRPALHRTAHLDLAETPSFEPHYIACDRFFSRYLAKFDHAYRIAPAYPYQARAILWELIWSVEEEQRRAPHGQPLPGQGRMHPAVAQALTWIEERLDQRILVSSLCRELPFSQSQLNRLFAERFGLSVDRYIRRRRMEEAEWYLAHSDLPIKQIAGRVGYPDLQHFNKIVRKTFGKSPRAVRATEGDKDENP